MRNDILLEEAFIAILWSISPLGEAKVGIPMALISGIDPIFTLISCFIANALVFPLMMFFLDKINKPLFKWRPYKRSAIFVAKRAKKGAGKGIKKYGFIGLIFFVMLPIPGTGVYAGTIASYLFGIHRQKAFLANTIGIFISCVLVWTSALFLNS